MGELLEEKRLSNKMFFKTLMTLIIPITLQNLISSSLNMVDNLMIGELGEAAIAGTGLVNQYFFVFTLTLQGINAGASIFISQFWGRKDKKNIKRMMGLDLILSFVAAIIFFIPGFFFPEKVMRIFVDDMDVILLGVEYLKIISLTFVITSVTQAYSAVLRCIGIAGPPMYGSLLGIVTNAFLNWVLIFGKLGAPALGVKGAAIATAIARVVEMTFVLVSSYNMTDVMPEKLKEFIDFDLSMIKTYFKTSTAVILNEITWSVGLSIFSIVYAQIGTREVASMQISNTVNNMFMVLSIGVASSSAIVIGNQIGAGDEELAMEYSDKFVNLAPFIGVITGLALWIASPHIVGIFNIDASTVTMTVNVLKIMALFAPLRFFNTLLIIGIFRGGGDTFFAMALQLGTVYFYAIPSGFIAAMYFKLSLEMVFLIMTCEEFIKFIIGGIRLRSGKWLRNVVGDL